MSRVCLTVSSAENFFYLLPESGANVTWDLFSLRKIETQLVIFLLGSCWFCGSYGIGLWSWMGTILPWQWLCWSQVASQHLSLTPFFLFSERDLPRAAMSGTKSISRESVKLSPSLITMPFRRDYSEVAGYRFRWVCAIPPSLHWEASYLTHLPPPGIEPRRRSDVHTDTFDKH